MFLNVLKNENTNRTELHIRKYVVQFIKLKSQKFVVVKST